MSDDVTLLRRYADERAEDAFAELVRRHLNLVYSVALRRTGGDAHLAADIAQCVFTALARRAGSLTRQAGLTGWLYTTTRHIAIDLVRAAQRRAAREREAHALHTVNSEPDPAWEHLQPLLEDVIDELTARDREAILLRFYQGLAFNEIGAHFGSSEDGARMRVQRALDKLHALLAKRGISSTSAALGVVLANELVIAAPAGLAASVTSSVMSGAAGIGFVGATIGFMGATKVIVSLTAAAAILIGVAAYQSHQARAVATALDRAQSRQAELAARVRNLTSEAHKTQQKKLETEAALARLPAERAAAESAARARLAAAEEERKRQDKALQDFLNNDAELVKLRRDERTARLSANFAPFSAERRESMVATRLAFLAANDARQSNGIPTDDNPMKVANPRSKVMAQQEIPRRLYYQDEPYTKSEAARLEAIFTRAAIPSDSNNHYAYFDWDRVIAEAAPVVSPERLQGLRGMAAGARDMMLTRAAVKEAAEIPGR